MITKTEAIVLRTIKYGEQRLIVDMFTRQQGRMAFIVPLPKSAHAKLRKQHFQPLSLLSIEADVRQQVQLQKLRETSVLYPLSSLLSQPEKLSISLFLSEFLYYALRDEQQNEALFDYVLSSIEWLDGCESGFANFHLVFLMRLSRFLGFWPNLEEGDPTPNPSPKERGSLEERDPLLTSPKERGSLFFDLRAATFCGAAPLHRDFLVPNEAVHIRTLMRMNFANMHLFRLSRVERHRILELLLLYYRLHLPSFPELKSLEVLQEMYDS